MRAAHYVARGGSRRCADGSRRDTGRRHYARDQRRHYRTLYRAAGMRRYRRHQGSRRVSLSLRRRQRTGGGEFRRRKRRSNKPLAVMVRDLADAERLCHINGIERNLLAGSIRPIVLLRRRAACKTSTASPTPSSSRHPSRTTFPNLVLCSPTPRFNICCLPRPQHTVCKHSS